MYNTQHQMSSFAGGGGNHNVDTEEERVRETVRAAVAMCDVIDVHTHLFPPSHGGLMLWGIDELLTYHYLVSEFFMVAPSELTYEAFFALSKREQADLVWDHLFLKRLPISEAQIGVLTTLNMLGLQDKVKKRDLAGIRKWFSKQDIDQYARGVFRIAGVKYAVMTNNVFLEEERAHWLKNGKDVPSYLRSAIRVDPLLKGDWRTVTAALRSEGFAETMEGLRQFLTAWASRIGPMYLMASTPADFVYGANDAPREPGWPTATEFIDAALIPVARKLNLPLAMKIGAWRGMSPSLNSCGGGDGVVVSDVTPIRELCHNFPDVKFLATFLSRVNQHEVCILSQKFRNLHIYGCWWYLNNPSIIEEITKMRVELLGSAFTAQHSDCRILDQILYKWKHSRAVISTVLEDQYVRLYKSGWNLEGDEIVRDVQRVLGGSFEEFLAK